MKGKDSNQMYRKRNIHLRLRERFRRRQEKQKKSKRRSVRNYIFLSNSVMVLLFLAIFFLLNILLLRVYSYASRNYATNDSELADGTFEAYEIMETWITGEEFVSDGADGITADGENNTVSDGADAITVDGESNTVSEVAEAITADGESNTVSNREPSLTDSETLAAVDASLDAYGFQLYAEQDAEVLYSGLDEKTSKKLNLPDLYFVADGQMHVYVSEGNTFLTYLSEDGTLRAYVCNLANSDLGLLRRENILWFSYYLVSGIVFILILGLASFLFTKQMIHHITKPLDALMEAAEEVRQGDYEHPIDYAGDWEFEEVCNSFNEMQSELLAAERKKEGYEKARNDMVAGISHDLRTPLTAIRGTIKGLRDGVASTPEMRDRFLDTAYRRTIEMDQILEQLFYYSKIETGNMPLLMEKVEWNEFLKDYIEELKAGRLATKNVSEAGEVEMTELSKVRVETGAGNTSVAGAETGTGNTSVAGAETGAGNTSATGVETGTGNPSNAVAEGKEQQLNIGKAGRPEIIFVGTDRYVSSQIDPIQMRRVLDNLVENSRKYAEAVKLRVTFELEYREKEKRVFLRISDNGNGVPKKKLPFVFDKFYRADESRNKTEGNGLGLYIVKYLVEAMSGTVEAGNKDGFEVTVSFPAEPGKKFA